MIRCQTSNNQSSIHHRRDRHSAHHAAVASPKREDGVRRIWVIPPASPLALDRHSLTTTIDSKMAIQAPCAVRLPIVQECISPAELG